MFYRARLRLVAWNVGILAVILVALGVAIFMLFQQNLYNGVDPVLRSEGINFASSVAEEAVITPVNPLQCTFPPAPPEQAFSPTNPTSYAAIDCHGSRIMWTPISRAGIMRALDGRTDLRTVKLGDDYWRVYSLPLVDNNLYPPLIIGAVQDWRSVDVEIREREQLLQVLIGGGLVGLLLAGLGGLFLAERALLPINRAFSRQRQFIADASHELRTPLTLIRGSAEMVARSGDRLDPEDVALLDDIVVEVDRLSQLVTDLLTLARVDVAQLNLRVDLLDLAALVRQVHADMRSLALRKDVQMTVMAPDTLLVLGDELRLRQLLLILLDNAIKYTPVAGRVDMSVARDGDRVQLTVTDTGVGIPADALPHVFDRFYRVESARTHETGGAGLGLSIAQWIARAHKGEITIISEVGQGTRVTVALPATDRPGRTRPRDEDRVPVESGTTE